MRINRRPVYIAWQPSAVFAGESVGKQGFGLDYGGVKGVAVSRLSFPLREKPEGIVPIRTCFVK
jgi:hypothetical protein